MLKLAVFIAWIPNRGHRLSYLTGNLGPKISLERVGLVHNTRVGIGTEARIFNDQVAQVITLLELRFLLLFFFPFFFSIPFLHCTETNI